MEKSLYHCPAQSSTLPTNAIVCRPADRRVTVVEAAAILGITPDAVRSRLRRGTLEHDEADDGTVLVVLNGDGPDASPPDHPAELLERELADWKEEARRKDHLLAAALERIPAIEEGPSEALREPRDGLGGAGRGRV